MPDRSTFAAIDFETADSKRDSACAVAVVRVERGEIVASEYRLIRPPRSKFSPFCVRVHGIHWEDVRDEPDFAGIWPDIAPVMDGVEYMVAHNASFDSSVLKACAQVGRVRLPPLPFWCTVAMSRRIWPGLENHKLNTVADFLGIPLQHHNAASDAEACARIAIEGLRANPTVFS